MSARRNVTGAPPAIQSWAGADEALGFIRELDASIGKREAEKEESLKALQDRYDAQITPLIERRDALAKALEEFTTFNRGDLDGQSRKLNHGVVGFRLGQRALAKLAKWTWAKVLEKIEAMGLSHFVRVKKEVDREAILRSDMDARALKTLGVEIVQEERFYYETAADETVAPKA